MRQRELRVGMAVRHSGSHKPLGRITEVCDHFVRLDGESPIATRHEIEPDPNAEEATDDHDD